MGVGSRDADRSKTEEKWLANRSHIFSRACRKISDTVSAKFLSPYTKSFVSRAGSARHPSLISAPHGNTFLPFMGRKPYAATELQTAFHRVRSTQYSLCHQLLDYEYHFAATCFPWSSAISLQSPNNRPRKPHVSATLEHVVLVRPDRLVFHTPATLRGSTYHALPPTAFRVACARPSYQHAVNNPHHHSHLDSGRGVILLCVVPLTGAEVEPFQYCGAESVLEVLMLGSQ